MYFPTGSTPSSVAIGDLDRDGHADLVVTNSAVYSESRISSISILRGNGDGTFAPGRVIPVGNVPQAVVIEDLDGDGFPDLAIANFGESPAYVGSVSVMMGYGDGTFRSAVDYTAGNMVRSLSAADLDGDGDLDLVTEDAVLLNNGDGTFGAAAAYGYDYADWLVAVGDLNRDGHPDLVTSDIDAEPGYDDEPGMWAYTVRLGNGDGTFRAPMRQGQGFRCWGLGLADLDGDGLLDLAICNHGDDRGYSSGVLVHLGRGDGTFGPARLFQTAWNPVSLAIADLNGDGKLDLITSNERRRSRLRRELHDDPARETVMGRSQGVRSSRPANIPPLWPRATSTPVPRGISSQSIRPTFRYPFSSGTATARSGLGIGRWWAGIPSAWPRRISTTMAGPTSCRPTGDPTRVPVA
jgi:hypothetical protein